MAGADGSGGWNLRIAKTNKNDNTNSNNKNMKYDTIMTVAMKIIVILALIILRMGVVINTCITNDPKLK